MKKAAALPDDLDLSMLDGLDDLELPGKPKAAAAPAADDDFDLSGLDGLDDLDFDAPAPKPAAQAAAADDLDLSGLDGLDDLDFSQPAAPAPKKAAALPDDLDLSMLDGLDDLDLPGKPKAAAAPTADDDFDLSGLDGLDDLDFDAPASKPAAQAQAADDLDLSGLDGLDDLDFSQPAAAPKKAAALPDDLDLSMLDGLDDLDLPGKPKAAAAPAADDDFDLSGLDGLDDLDFDAPAPKPAAQAAAADDLDLSGLDGLDDLDFSQPAAAPKKAAALPDDLDLSMLDGLDDLDLPGKPKAAAPVADETFDLAESLDDLVPTPPADDFDLSGFEDGLGDLDLAAPEPEVKPKKAALSDDLDLVLADGGDLGLPEKTKPTLTIEESPVADSFESLDDFVVPDAPKQDAGLTFEMLDAEETAAGGSVADTFADLGAEADLTIGGDDGWLDGFDDGLALADLPEPDDVQDNISLGELAEFDADDSELNAMLAGADREVGFVSGAVGNEEPQEAKLDLAKMYLDIEDEAAARETLRELVAEADGEVLAEAKRLLQGLG